MNPNYRRFWPKTGRNDPCPCGSGKKFKHCCAKVTLHTCISARSTTLCTGLDEITVALRRGDRVELRGFGAFSVKHRAAHLSRNPRTGAQITVDHKRVPAFKTGKEMRE